MELEETDREAVLRLDRETFEVNSPFHKDPQPFVIPTEFHPQIESEEIDHHREHLEEAYQARRGPKNQMPAREGQR